MYAAIDFESQGFDPVKDAPTEIGIVIFNDNFEELNAGSCLINSSITRPQPQEIIDITGITDEMIAEKGVPEKDVVDNILLQIRPVKAIFAYNAPFDVSFLNAMLKRQGHPPIDMLVVDVQRDIDYPARFTCKKLTHLAFDHGIVGDAKDAHRAVYDVRLMLKLLQKYDLQTVIKNAAEPKVNLRIKTPPPWEDKQGNEYAKANGFRFIPETKFWCKQVRKSEVEQIIKGSKYPIERLK